MRAVSRNRYGLTLIELLAAMSIVVMLLAIVFVGIGRAKERAKMATCTGNLRAIGQGILLFANDNNGELPPGAELGGFRFWFHALEPYINGYETDPESPDRPAWQQCPAKQFPTPERRNIGYGWNYQNFGSRESSPAHGWRTRLNAVEEPANTIIVGNSADLEVVGSNAWMNIYIYDERFPERHARRHNGGGNYLMVDGSVRFFTSAELVENPSLFRVRK